MARNDDIQLHQYQDDLNTDDNATDPIMDEETDDPTEALQIPPASSMTNWKNWT